MKRVITSLLTGVLILSMTACGKDATETQVVSKDEVVSDISLEDIAVQSESLEAEPEEGQVNQIEQVGSGESEVALTQEELSEIEQIIGTSEYGSFLMSEYETAQDIDWNDVFYSGAGIAVVGDVSDEEYAAFEQELGYEPTGDVLAIKRGDLEAFVKKNTGLNYSEARKPYKATYIEKYDSYYVQRSDGCFPRFKCVSGTKKGDVYTVYTEDEEGYRGRNASYFTFKKDGKNLVVISHRFA